MSHSHRPSKSHRRQHRRLWIREKQTILAHHHNRVVGEAIDAGLEDHEHRDLCGWVDVCDYCLEGALERLGEIELHEASGELPDDVLHVDG